MAQFATKTDKRTELNDVVSDIHRNDVNNAWADNTVKGIIKAIQWPKPLTAIKYAAYSISASVVIGGILYVYGYAINQAISMIR